MGVGSPHRLIDELVRQGRKSLTVIANDTARPGIGIGCLIDAKDVKRLIVSHIGTNPETQRQMIAGELAVEISPQGTLAERIRAAGYGLGGVLTPTGVGTNVAEGKREIDIDGKKFLLELPIFADFALLGAHRADYYGNLDYLLTDAGGSFIGAVPGACSFDSCFSFGLIRGGHLDVTVLGGLEVDEQGLPANWTIPGKMVPGMGVAIDLVTGTKRVIVAMVHTAKGKSKILKKCTLPLTSVRPVNLVVTELVVIEPSKAGLILKEVVPGVTVDQVIQATEAKLIVPARVSVMAIAA